MTPITTQHGRLKVKLIGDFERQGLIGRWFGGLQLVSVKMPKKSRPSIADTACRVICPNGHLSSRTWWEIRDHNRQRVCGKCKTPKPKPAATNPGNEELLKSIGELPPDRRLLFDTLMDSRRRIPGQDETPTRELLNDAYSYARDVKDPQKELKDWEPEDEYETYGKSSLCSPNFMYVATE